MPLSIFDGKLVLRDGDLALTEECCTCCLCEDTNTLEEECGVDYIAVELEICMETCRDDNGDYRACPDAAWTVQLALNAGNGWFASGYFSSNAAAGPQELAATTDDIQFPMLVETQLSCGSFGGDLFLTVPTIAGEVYLLQGKLFFQGLPGIDSNCYELSTANLQNYLNPCRGLTVSNIGNPEIFFATPLAMKKKAGNCCPEVPENLLELINPKLREAYAVSDGLGGFVPYESCTGFVLKVTAVTIVYA